MTLSFYLPKWLKYSISIAFTTFITLSGIYAQQAKSSSEINLYSSRHYDTDKRLYSDFENKTGIKIRRIEDLMILESLQTYKAMMSLTVAVFEKWPFEKQLAIGMYSVHNGDNLFLISQ